jgi:hypothetical protein
MMKESDGIREVTYIERVRQILTQMKTKGWESYTTKKGMYFTKSVFNKNGEYVFENSISKKHPLGRCPTYKDALMYKSVIEPNGAKRVIDPIKNPIPIPTRNPEENVPPQSTPRVQIDKSPRSKPDRTLKKVILKRQESPKYKESFWSRYNIDKKPTIDVGQDTEEFITVWEYEGQLYLKTMANECWHTKNGKDFGEWVGIYDPITDSMDTSYPAPLVVMS